MNYLDLELQVYSVREPNWRFSVFKVFINIKRHSHPRKINILNKYYNDLS